MKLVWMVLAALPMIALTACGDDEPDNGISFKDYSFLLDEDRQEILNKKMKGYEPVEEDLYGVYYESDAITSLGDNISEVNAYFTFWEETSYGYVTYEDCVQVDVCLEGFADSDMFNYLTNKYGKAQMIEDDEDEDYVGYEFTKGNMYVWYDYIDKDEIWVSYVDKKEFDKYVNSLPNAKAARKGLKAARKARRAK